MQFRSVEDHRNALVRPVLTGAFAGGFLFASAILVFAWRKADLEEALERFARDDQSSG